MNMRNARPKSATPLMNGLVPAQFNTAGPIRMPSRTSSTTIGTRNRLSASASSTAATDAAVMTANEAGEDMRRPSSYISWAPGTVGSAVLSTGHVGSPGRGAVATDRPVLTAAAHVGLCDTDPVVEVPHARDGRAQLLLDRRQLVVVEVPRLGVFVDLRLEVLVAEPELQPAALRGRCERERLHLRGRHVADARVPQRSGLVVARIEQSVVDPDRVDPRRRHEHRRRLPVESRELVLVRGAGGAGRRTPARMPRHQLAHRVAVGAVSDQHFAHVLVVVARAGGVDPPQHVVDEKTLIVRRRGIACRHAEQLAAVVGTLTARERVEAGRCQWRDL